MRRSLFRRTLQCALAFSAVALLGACDDDDVFEDEDVFAAELDALNNSGVDGTATFRVDEDGLFVTEVAAAGLAPGQEHAQHIHAAGQCPPASAAGEDGLLSVAEGAPFYGLIVLPLDSDITNQTLQDFPDGNVVAYQESADFDAVLAAITGTDDNPDDLITKIQGTNLNLDTRTVVLHGAFVMDNQIVPAGTAGATYDPMVPVACGTLVELDT